MNQTIDKRRFAELIRAFDFRTLFNELGWDFTTQKQVIPVDGFDFELNAAAEKRGFVIFVCQPDVNGKIPAYDTRRKIDNRLSKLFFEHLIIYTDRKHLQQMWQVVIRELGKPVLPREVTYYIHQEPQLLYQKLSGLFFALDEEDKIGIVDVHARVTNSFNENAEKVTKKFYDQFKKEHTDFMRFIEGIPLDSDIEWYASIMLNRLMFIYFIQKKGFLDNDNNYLRTKLRETQNKKGQDRYYSFYRSFLRVLFHQGLNMAEHSPELIREIGRIPYLNGGLFDVHKIEKDYPEIQIKDRAFEQIFDFFDEWNWHLDTRMCATGRDVNPDVLGYVYEKYINQKQMGAYYTKEDITGYISQNTIVPCLFDKAKKECKIAFDGEQTFWNLIQNDPDRYFYDAVKKGVELPLPPEIEIGVDTSQPNLIERRKDWNKPAPAEYALPTEIWREVVARRKRYEETWQKMVSGEIREINDFITYNLNIRQFALDVIVNCEGPELLRAFWKTIREISILDPTVGSGAFLFAALNILESLYEACLDRMQAFLEELENSGEKHRSDKYGDFREILAQIEKHPNRRYFIFKSIIVNNLYGVDIMEEAVEICRLRLFLKLVAETEVDYAKPYMGLEPLPDIDFNIKAGNSLVGFATHAEVKKSVEGFHQLELGFVDYMKVINEKAEVCAKTYNTFKKLQIEGETEQGQIARAKTDLQDRLTALDAELDRYLAVEYGKNPEKKAEYDKWLRSHQPFHWFVEFYGIVHQRGGFDVIIGNPPYVEYGEVVKDYTIKGYATESCGNLYAFIIEKTKSLSSHNGYIGVIVPISIGSTPRMMPIRKLFRNEIQFLYTTNFADRPSCLFNGVHQILSICIIKKGKQYILDFFSSGFEHWNDEEREYLFTRIIYYRSNEAILENTWGKYSYKMELSIFKKIQSEKHSIISFFLNRGEIISISGGTGGYWLRAFIEKQKSNEYKEVFVNDKSIQLSLCGIFNSTLFYWHWRKYSDCRHLTKNDIGKFNIKLTDNLSEHLNSIVTNHLQALNETKELRIGKMSYEQYRPGKTKPIIDEIDRVLAEHYGFTEEELDFIINYDIKYRMGKNV